MQHIPVSRSRNLRVALEGCAVRNSHDLSCMSVPQKYKQIGDFHEYYSGARVAPYLTIFVGGNHEASNHLFELYYGGWVAPNIYYLGAANVIRCGPLRIAGISGIWKGYDYHKSHFERLPYNRADIQSIYHIRELDVRKLLQIRTQVDLGLSHDWPQGIEWHGDFQKLFQKKPLFEPDANSGRLGSVAARYIMDRLRPAFWFSAHLHCKYAASLTHGDYKPAGLKNRFNPNPQPHQQPQQPSLGDDALNSPSLITNGQPDAPGSTNEGITATQSVEMVLDAAHISSKEVSTTIVDTAMSEEIIMSTLGGDGEATTRAAESAENAPQPQPAQGAERDRAQLSAWQNFHSVATKNDAEESARLMKEAAEYEKQIEAGLISRPEVAVKDDNLGREIKDVAKIGYNAQQELRKITEQETRGGGTEVKNPDEIDISLDSSSDTSEKLEQEDTASTKPRNTDKMEIEHSISSGKAEKTATAAVDAAEASQSGDIPKEIRDQLPASFRKPETILDDAPVFESTLPEAISNTETSFLALDKCDRHRQFIELVEYPAISSPEEGETGEESRPYQLKYDKEWLAITRAFANELTLGDPNASVPTNKGDARYKPSILAAEQWIEENVVKPGRMTIPHNFSITAPVHDPAVPITTTEMPPEYTNPQTAQFCDLIGIENKFHASDEERFARADAGPLPEPLQQRHGQRFRGHQDSSFNSFGRGRGRGFGRDGGRWQGGRGGRGGGGRNRAGRGGRGGRGEYYGAPI
ncbi:RNA lariat debranching enzyme [Histoplasma capsulatum var. duboisii H88]|uniref:RNA lariat debranching enzyme n=1 Tax=Ajellomyces capsulatus (strain H88) TaxID=544711 RepID=F0UNU5_AJEC8|nr:RNA lariat debranching enzyme [Histoplasma capsulatum var. duboisii H88]